MKDLDWKFSRGTGPGGQHRNKTDSCVNLTHLPTKIKVRCDGRSQTSNKETALSLLRLKLRDLSTSTTHSSRNKKRSQQVGKGMRGDKIRTIRVRDNRVTDHLTGKITSWERYRRGDLGELK